MAQIRYQQSTMHHASPISTRAATASRMSLPGLMSFQIWCADRPRFIGTETTPLPPSSSPAPWSGTLCAGAARGAAGALTGDRKRKSSQGDRGKETSTQYSEADGESADLSLFRPRARLSSACGDGSWPVGRPVGSCVLIVRSTSLATTSQSWATPATAGIRRNPATSNGISH